MRIGTYFMKMNTKHMGYTDPLNSNTPTLTVSLFKSVECTGASTCFSVRALASFLV
jgi:hypothetical protein